MNYSIQREKINTNWKSCFWYKVFSS